MANDLDIFARAPGQNVPYVLTVMPFVADGSITIDFNNTLNDPQINGIEVFTNGEPTPVPVDYNGTFSDILVNCGGTYL